MPKKQQAKKLKAPRDNFFNVIASIYGVPTSGIDAIGTQPYLNKDGRLFLLQELRTGKQMVKAIHVEVLRYSTSIIEPAIVKKIIVFKDGTEVEAIGEASQDSVETDSVKKTLNMVAETRALNRAIWVAIAADVMKRVEKNLRSMDISEADRARIMEAGRVSYEEAERPKGNETNTDKSKELYDKTIERLEKLIGDDKRLKQALVKVNQLPLTDEQKRMIEDTIKNKLLGGSKKK